MTGDERREYNRVDFKTAIDLYFPEQVYNRRETRDLSVAGAFVLGIMDRKRGSRCDVILHLTGESSDLLLKMRGEVVRLDKNGIALQFFDVDPDSFYHLKNIVYLNFMKGGDSFEFEDTPVIPPHLEEFADLDDDLADEVENLEDFEEDDY